MRYAEYSESCGSESRAKFIFVAPPPLPEREPTDPGCYYFQWGSSTVGGDCDTTEDWTLDRHQARGPTKELCEVTRIAQYSNWCGPESKAKFLFVCAEGDSSCEEAVF